ncbi:hypothetical protein C9374_000176 [Naegleria lovaniensis]|uniref:Sec1-like protein n=1 Tax=Naegleria lovaniensis TaxID=51637 RepID=A0AA88KTN4_NAELO|nr:uncharacterized protein C9374_000176 [Naegleria lovaniensis]KAG2388737.1 hypothetical protein C9374_000176 [Naegleria lovaniensis]
MLNPSNSGTVATSPVLGTDKEQQRKMNVVRAVKDYILDMVDSVKGVKVLLLDEYTRDIVSVVTPFSLIMQKNVFLVDLLNNEKRQPLPNMRAIVFVRPTSDNAMHLKAELLSPKYQSYSVFFSNVASQNILEKIASSDKNELVKNVFEYFSDYLALDNTIFSFNIPSTISLLNASWDDPLISKINDGLTSLLISLRKKPFIRYQKSSDLCKKLATELSERISTNNHDNGVFDFKMESETRYHAKAPPPPILLILDRRDDPITPLLTQWTYQAMIHELLGLQNNVVTFPSDKREEVISSQYDEFFANNMYENWGDLCKNVKKVVDRYQENHNMKENIQSIEDLAKFMHNFPVFKKQQQEVEKHVSIVTELRSIVAKRRLLDISEVEQELVCGKSHADNYEALQNMLNKESLSEKDAIRLVLLYALRYEDRKAELKNLKSLLSRKGVKNTALVDYAIKYGGKSQRTPGLFDEAPTSISLTGFFKKVASEFQDKEVTNVFTQHKPRLYDTLDLLFKGKLSFDDYPFISLTSRETPQEVIVFIVGGFTYEEASSVELFNSKSRREADENAKVKANFGVISS